MLSAFAEGVEARAQQAWKEGGARRRRLSRAAFALTMSGEALTSELPLGALGYTVDLALEVAEAMAFLHSRTPPIVHRDLTSSNVMLSRSRDAKVGDFGLARTVAPSAGARRTLGEEVEREGADP